MKHEQPDHFAETDPQNKVNQPREDQIMRVLQDIGFLPRHLDADIKGGSDDKV
ncbi:hypothetical protein [Roseobacter sp.]|uniref:hypothetical protein n=1 Tax=Roseobacter sp. TaxID=1907202 RepID=UPI00385FD6C2